MEKRAKYRMEKDSLGKLKIPAQAFYGIETQRAKENFPISDIKLQWSFIKSYLIIKKAAALANKKLKKLDPQKAGAIIKACSLLLEGKHHDQFIVGVFQAGAGTSQNMNMNETIANLALTLMHKKKGEYAIIHPHDHVNLSQSTNDTFHAAMHITAYLEIQNHLLPALQKLEKALGEKAVKFKEVIKSGRTHLRDAVPITLGQEFQAFANTIGENKNHIKKEAQALLSLNIGGTAIGTGINANKKYRNIVLKQINQATKCRFKPAKDMIEATASLSTLLKTSSALKNLAIDAIKIANDIRLLNSGPSAGINEIILPELQPGSSIMPGKINPVVAEMLDMVGFQVVGNDTTITLAAQAGQLELNVMMPIVAYNLINSIEILGHAIDVFTEKCIRGIKANEKKCQEYLERNPIIITLLTPKIGYEKAAELTKKAYQKGTSIKSLLEKEKILSEKEINKLFNLKPFTKMKKE